MAFRFLVVYPDDLSAYGTDDEVLARKMVESHVVYDTVTGLLIESDDSDDDHPVEAVPNPEDYEDSTDDESDED